MWNWINKYSGAVSVLVAAIPICVASTTYSYKNLFPKPENVIIIDASDFSLHDEVAMNNYIECNAEYLTSTSLDSGANIVEYLVSVKRRGRYRLYLEHATGGERKVNILQERKPVDIVSPLKNSGDICKNRLDFVAHLNLKRGDNLISIVANPMPKIKRLKFVRHFKLPT